MIYLCPNQEEYSMNANVATASRSDTTLEAFAAELTEAAFPVALQHGAGTDWLDAKLELWRALTRAVRKWTPELCEVHASY
jgi:hypothetical protein